MEENGYKYTHKLTEFVKRLNSRRNCPIDLTQKSVKNSHFLSILYSKPLRQFKKPKFKNGDRVRILTYPSGRVVRDSLRKRFSKLLQFLQENFKRTQKRMNKIRLTAVDFVRKNWSKSINNGIAYNRVGFKCICATASRQYNQLLYNFFTRATESGSSIGSCNFRKNPTHFCTNVSRRENSCFLTRSFRSYQNSTIWNMGFALPLRILL